MTDEIPTVDEQMRRRRENAAALRDLEAERDQRVARGEPPRVVADRVETPAEKPAAAGPSGWASSELWVTLLLPIVCGALVAIGWLSEDTVQAFGVTGSSAYVLSRTAVKAVREWRAKS